VSKSTRWYSMTLYLVNISVEAWQTSTKYNCCMMNFSSLVDDR
jgi:hypothetical protein